ncbi:hypothetical protein V6N13_059974 [Hibiscus sabdariffa]
MLSLRTVGLALLVSVRWLPVSVQDATRTGTTRLLVSVRTCIHMTVGGFENMSYRYAKGHIGTARLVPVRLPQYRYAFWFLEFPVA